MTKRVIAGRVVQDPPRTASREPDALDGAVNRVVAVQEGRCLWRFKAWAFVAIVLLVMWALQRLQWEWVVSAAAGLFSLVNFLGLLFAGAEFSRAEIRRRLIAESRYRQAGGR